MVVQRKTVSVAFADLVESSSLAERLDPEVLANVLRRYFAVLQKVVESHGGTVEKFIGDAVVGFFGVPVLHEDDALRAVRAALRMHDAVRQLNEELRPTLGIELVIRVGVNTGEVIASADNAMGHAISMAARLEQNAAAGEVLIGKQTHALVSGAVVAEAVADLAVKGSSEPLAAWRVTGETETAAGKTRSSTRYVGRQRELSAIADEFESARTGQACVTVTVIAPPGLGKSRLMAQAVAAMPAGVRVIGGSCPPYGEGITYAPLIEAVRSLPPGELERAFAATADGEQALARVRATVAGSSNGSPDETAWAFRRTLETLATERPLVVVLDDLHWADPLLLDLIEYVATFSAGRPILLMCAARPDLLEKRPTWPQMGASGRVLRLAPLSADETQGLLAGLDADGLAPEVRQRIVDASGGVPLFVEQMAAFDADQAGGGIVPPTIRALLAARVDSLTAEERSILEHAVIEGQVFHRDTLARLMPEAGRGTLGAHLIGLMRREFVQPQPSADGRDAFSFSHALVRDAVYEQMPRRSRSELHERYAVVLADRGAPDELVAYHLEEAYRERVALGEPRSDVEDLRRRTGLALAAAGRNAATQKESTRALDLLTRSADLLTVAPAERVMVLPDLIDAHVAAGELEAAAALRDEAVALAQTLGDDTSELRAQLAWARTGPSRDATGWQERSSALIDRALEHFTRVGDHVNIADVLLLKAWGLAARDSFAAIETLKQAQVHAIQSGDERHQVEVWDELGGTMLFGPTPYPETLEFVRAEAAWAREHGIPFTAADGRLGEAYSLAALAQFDEARAVLDELMSFFAELPGHVSQHGECYTLAGRIERDRGNFEESARLYRRAMELFAESGLRRWWRNAAPGVAHALLDLDRVDDAKVVLDEIAAQAQTGQDQAGAFRLEAEARYRVRTGDVEAGLERARQAVDAVAGTGAIQYEGRARETLAGLLAQTGAEEAAADEYALARALYVAKGYVPGISRIDALRART